MRRSYWLSLIVIVVAAASAMSITLVKGYKPALGLDLKGGTEIVLQPTKPGAATKSLNEATNIVRNRVNGLGISEANVDRQGDSIIVDLPGVKDQARAESVIGTTAKLTIREVISAGSSTEPLTPHDQTDANASVTVKDRTGTVYKLGPPGLVGTDIKSADAGVTTDTGQWIVNVAFKSASKWDNFANPINTKQGQLAIVLDGNVSSAPRIDSRIPHGRAVITLGSSMDSEQLYNEASDLVVVLRAGSLPAPVTIEENRTVGPSLGKDSIEQGRLALIIGSAMVILFMLFYYKSAGVVAVIALMLNVLFIMAILTLFQATLTLPGIAGIILTIGMAVDGNVIINERIKEELQAGRSLQSAIGLGYDRAQITLLDANLTTFIAGIILFQYGTGPIQGFAVTLMIGVVTSFITSLSVTRFIFEFYLEKLKFKSLWI